MNKSRKRLERFDKMVYNKKFVSTRQFEVKFLNSYLNRQNVYKKYLLKFNYHQVTVVPIYSPIRKYLANKFIESMTLTQTESPS